MGRRPRLRRRWTIVGASTLLALAAGGALIARDGRDGAGFDSNLVAVAPFGVLDPQLQLWREGLVDLLSRNLDGAGPLRTVSPTVIVRRWEGSADRSSSGQLARRVGARFVIFGTLVRSGADSVRVDVTLLDARAMRVLAEAQLRDQAQRMDRLSDSLTLTLLRELGRGQPIRAVRLAGFGRTSLPALKAFLQGEQHYRRAEMDSAQRYYERAVALDSTFAVAYQRLGRVAAWRTFQGDSLSRVYALRAGALNRGIAPRESLLIVADSLYAALERWERDPAFWSHVTRQMQTLELAARRYPDDPEVWSDLGEARHHYGPFLGVTPEEALAALARAIAIDSAFGLPYAHTVELALALDGVTAARNYVRAYLATKPAGEFALEMRIMERLLDPRPRATLALDRLLDTIPSHALAEIAIHLEDWPDSGETAVRVARVLAARRERFADFNLCRRLILRGHLREAKPCAIAARDSSPLLYGDLALLGAVPPESVRVTVARDLHKRNPFPTLVWSSPLWAVLGDTSLQKIVRWSDSALRVATDSAVRRFAQVGTYSARAYLALARHDTTDALRQFLSMPDSLRPWKVFGDLTPAQLLAARGRDRDALRLLRVRNPNGGRFGYDVLLALERGRVAERIGERQEAARAYRYVANIWMHADPELQPYVVEARRALEQLRADRRQRHALTPPQR